MEPVDVQGLHPRLAASVALLAARKGRAVAGVTPLIRTIMAGRDP